MNKTRLRVPKMDCAAEERLVRMALHDQPSIHRLDVDLSARSVEVYHNESADRVLQLLESLGLGVDLVETGSFEGELGDLPQNTAAELRILWIALGINAGMFLAESIGGYIADSSALLADSLDMFADAAVYGIALYGVGKAAQGRITAAQMSGWLQLALAGGALFEVVRRAVAGSEPESALMMAVVAAALTANATTMWLLARHRTGGAHMKASWIFTTNDVLANLGVIVGAVLVRMTGSAIPDLVVGGLIAVVVFVGALRILRLAIPQSS